MAAAPKIIDLLTARKEEDGPFVSLEYFPPRSDTGVKNLFARTDRMRDAVKPLFSDCTWGAGGSTAELTMRITKNLHDTGHVANMHLTCTNMTKDGDPKAAVQSALEEAFDMGVRNVVALRGDPPAGQEQWEAAEGGFQCALDLVKYIRSQPRFADCGISVAGYPEGHPNAISQLSEGEEEGMTEKERLRSSTFDGVTYVCKDADYEKELDYLKEKIDAGGDFIITQMFFDADTFLQFVDDCRAKGIDCPIVPGLMCINNYPGFQKMTKFCKTRVPASLQSQMDSLKNCEDDKVVKAFGVKFGVELCRKLLDSGKVPGLHFYTLNLETVVYGILKGLNLMSSSITQNGNADADAKSMVAVGSAWARVGDEVSCVYGRGVVKEIRVDGVNVIEMNSWVLANGQKPCAFLRQGSFAKAF